MKQDGFTLIELLVVVGIISILVIVAGFEFTGWMARYNVESQIKTMHIDLQTARQRAMQKNTQYVVQLAADGKSYLICEDTNANGVCGDAQDTTMPAFSKNGLRYQMNSNIGGATIVMNTRGTVMLSTGPIDNSAPKNVWLLDPDTGGYYDPAKGKIDYDCISLSTTRIGFGKYDGATCNVK
jgi:prepilin-type N-terminal cleavage/methylation domain-containing protein